MSKKPKGQCHICGKYGELSFKHTPPENALNNKQTKIYVGEEALKIYKGEKARFMNQQQGMGKYTLCKKCNNNTGSWYVPTYNDVAKDVASYLHKTKQLNHGDIVSFDFKNVPVLSFVKQVITMFCSLLPYSEVKRLGFDKFLLSKESNTIDKSLFDLRIHLTPINVGQLMVGPAIFSSISDSGPKATIGYDLGAYPFGFILNLTPENPIEYGTSLINLFDAEYGKEYQLRLELMLLEKTSDVFPIPLLFKPLPKGKYEEEK